MICRITRGKSMPANILVVEDEPAIQELLTLNLVQAGHNPIRALSVEQGQKLMRETLPDLILLDWKLPGMGGIEFARRLKSAELITGIHVILMHARGEDLDQGRGMEGGEAAYDSRPDKWRVGNECVGTGASRGMVDT